jgi:hypothetical protein
MLNKVKTSVSGNWKFIVIAVLSTIILMEGIRLLAEGRMPLGIALSLAGLFVLAGHIIGFLRWHK